MKYGDVVGWMYTHHLGRKSSVKREKFGLHLGRAKHTIRHWRKPGAEQMVYVRFFGNKSTSLVRERELFPLEGWLPYEGSYEKVLYDILLVDGSIVRNCWPNAGAFHPVNRAIPYRGEAVLYVKASDKKIEEI